MPVHRVTHDNLPSLIARLEADNRQWEFGPSDEMGVYVREVPDRRRKAGDLETRG